MKRLIFWRIRKAMVSGICRCSRENVMEKDEE